MLGIGYNFLKLGHPGGTCSGAGFPLLFIVHPENLAKRLQGPSRCLATAAPSRLSFQASFQNIHCPVPFLIVPLTTQVRDAHTLILAAFPIDCSFSLPPIHCRAYFWDDKTIYFRSPKPTETGKFSDDVILGQRLSCSFFKISKYILNLSQ